MAWRWFAIVALLLPAMARAEAPPCAEAARLVWPDDAEMHRLIGFSGSFCAIASWPGGGPQTYAVAAARDDTLMLGLLRGGATPRVLARGAAEALAFESLQTPLLQIDPAPLGPGQPAIGVRLSNSATTTGRSDSTEALHVFIRRDAELAPVFAGYLRAAHSETGPCARNRRAMCRSGWERRWTITPSPARGGRPPELVVRDARSGAIVGRHRWRGQAYQPAISDRTPAIGPT